MQKARLLLVGVMALVYLGLGYLSNKSQVPAIHRYVYHGIPRTYADFPIVPIFFHIVLAVLFVAALFILLSTFFHVHKDERGYYYDPRNFFWRTMRHFYGYSWPARITLCRAYWLTVGFSAMLTIVTIVATAIMYAAYCALTMPWNVPTRAELLAIGVVLGIAMGVIVLLSWIANTSRIGERIVVGFVITVVVGLVIVVPILAMSTGPHAVPVLVAILMYLSFMAKYVGLSVAAIWAGYKYIPVLKKSAIGRFLVELKNDYFCPILEARTPQSIRLRPS